MEAQERVRLNGKQTDGSDRVEKPHCVPITRDEHMLSVVDDFAGLCIPQGVRTSASGGFLLKDKRGNAPRPERDGGSQSTHAAADDHNWVPCHA